MPRNGSGTYSLPTGNPVISRTVIRTLWANPTLNDIAVALTGSMARDGQSAPTSNIPMAGFRFLNVGLATSLTDLARTSQVQDGSLLRCTGEAMPSADVYTGNLPFGATSFVNGQIIVYQFPTTNIGAAPTLNINGSANWPILRADGSSIQPGDCRTTTPSQLMWNSTTWLLLGAGGSTGAGVITFNTRTGAVTLLSADVTSALGYMPFDKNGGAFTGPVTLFADAATSLQPVTLQQMLATIAAIPTVAGVNTFNTRSGAVTLLSADVTTALGFSPVQTFNGRTGVVTLTSPDVTGALGFTPAAALGYVPFNKAGDTATFIREVKVAKGSVSSSTSLDWSTAGLMTATVTGSGAIFTHANLPTGVAGYLTLDLTNGGVATSVSTLFPGVKWPGGASLFSLTASGRDIITLMCNDGVTVNVVGFGKGMA